MPATTEPISTPAPVNGAPPEAEPFREEVLVRELRRLLRGLRFGAIELVVHDGVVTQIERREKLRLR